MAVDLTHEVLTVAYTSPRAKYAALVAWAGSVAHVPEYLDALHSGKQ